MISVSEFSGPHDMETIEKKNHNLCILIFMKIEEALKYNKKWCVSFLHNSNTICCWSGVTGSHDMEIIEKKT